MHQLCITFMHGKDVVGEKPRKATQKNLISNAVFVKFVFIKCHASEIITISDCSQACRQCGAFETEFWFYLFCF